MVAFPVVKSRGIAVVVTLVALEGGMMVGVHVTAVEGQGITQNHRQEDV